MALYSFQNSIVRAFIFALTFLLFAFPVRVHAQEELEELSLVENPRRIIDDRPPFYIKPDTPLKITAVGDLMMSSWIIDLVREQGVDFPFDSTRSWVESADLAIANLEAPLTTSDNKFPDKTFTFKVPPEFVNGIANAGFDVVTMANNHIADYGCEGIQHSIETLTAAGIQFCGAGATVDDACAPAIIETNGLRVAFVGFSMTYPEDFWASKTRCGTCYPTPERLYEVINECEMIADLTIASFHWGAEKHTTPREYQIQYAHMAIDYGADLVLGHHPHVLQGLELYKNKLIAYSLGNYVFASYSNSSRTSIVLRCMIRPEGLVLARVVPINVHNATVKFQPVEFKGSYRDRVIQDLNSISKPLNNGAILIDAEGFILPSHPQPQRWTSTTEVLTR